MPITRNQSTNIAMQEHSNEELCNLLIQSLIAKDENLMQKVLEQEDDAIIKDIINRVPVNHVRKLIIELRNILSTKLTVNHLRWLQHLLALKYTVISSMADGRSILIPLISLLEDRSSPLYYTKMQGLQGKLTLLKQLKEARRSDKDAQTIVRVQVEPEERAQMEIDSETDTESEEEFDDDKEEEADNEEKEVEEGMNEDDDDGKLSSHSEVQSEEEL